jgi:hypothetical protein
VQTASLDLLEKTQLPPNQARAILTAMEMEMTAREERLSTKSELKDAFHSLELTTEALRGDIQALRAELKADAQALRAEVKADIQALRAELKGDNASLRAESKGTEGKLMRWVLTCMLGQTAVLAGAMYFALTHLRP